jgi:hypothetical protein
VLLRSAPKNLNIWPVRAQASPRSLIHLTPHMSPQPDNDEEVPLEIHSLEESVGHPKELVNYAKIETSVIVNQREHMCYE